MQIYNKYLSESIVKELNQLENTCFLFDTPVPFKGKLKLYPVMIENYVDFVICSACCTLNKNKTPEGIRFSHLGFLIHQMEQEGGQFLASQFSRLLEIVFHIKNGIRCTKCGEVYSFEQYLSWIKEKAIEDITCPNCGNEEFEEVVKFKKDAQTNKYSLEIDGIEITAKDFDRFRQLVLYQNFPDYQDDSWVNEEIREDQRLRRELLSKNSKEANATLEKKIVCVAAATGYKLEDLYKTSVRKFLMLLTTVDDMITYQANRIGLMTGMVKTKQPIEHWIYKPTKSLYEGYRDMNEYTSTIQSVNK